VTGLLGFRYVFIDALCVIQAFMEEYAKEVPHMGQVYRHCALRVAAIGVENVSHGLFHERDPQIVPVCET
jgi:hypothetical protein